VFYNAKTAESRNTQHLHVIYIDQNIKNVTVLTNSNIIEKYHGAIRQILILTLPNLKLRKANLTSILSSALTIKVTIRLIAIYICL